MGTGEIYMNKTTVANAIRSRINKWDFIKLEICKAKDTVMRTKWQTTDWEYIFTNTTSYRGLISNINKELKSVDSRESKKNPIKMGRKNWFFYWIFFIYISNVIPFLGFPDINPLHITLPFFYQCVLLIIQPLTTNSPAFHYTGVPTLAELRAFPSIGSQQDHHLLHIQLKPWVSPCIVFG